jgi:hypothetical protein
MHLGQAQIQDQQIKFVAGHQGRVSLAAAGHMVTCRTGCTQSAQQAIGQHLIVFCNEYAHACLLGVFWTVLRLFTTIVGLAANLLLTRQSPLA